MGSLDSYDPGNGPVLPDLPLSIAALAARLNDLFSEAQGLALPWVATADEASQLLALEFGPNQQSVSDIAAWSFRFGGVVQSHPCGMFDTEALHVIAHIDYGGITVSAYAFIPQTPYDGQEGDSDDSRY
jgi:hypothetical protein